MQQIGIEVPDYLFAEFHGPNEPGTTGNINGNAAPALIHRDNRRAITVYSLPVAKRLPDGLSQTDADILDQMMVVNSGVPATAQNKIDHPVA